MFQFSDIFGLSEVGIDGETAGGTGRVGEGSGGRGWDNMGAKWRYSRRGKIGDLGLISTHP
jgi:hypothetical protein